VGEEKRFEEELKLGWMGLPLPLVFFGASAVVAGALLLSGWALLGALLFLSLTPLLVTCPERVLVTAHSRALTLGGRTIARSKIGAAYMRRQTSRGPTVFVQISSPLSRNLELRVPDEETGRALIAALRLDPAPDTVVGTDGVHTTWMGSGRFIPHANIAQVWRRRYGVELVLGSGATVFVPTREGGDETRDALFERIRQARVGEAGAHEGVAALVARGGRTMQDWIHQLRALGVAEGDYRAVALAPDYLWRVVEDAGTDPSARAGAAIALGPRLDDAGRARLRAVAEATASPKLRIALDAASETDETRIAEALTAHEAQSDKGQTKFAR
jgi:hypothetical protein